MSTNQKPNLPADIKPGDQNKTEAPANADPKKEAVK